MEFSTLISVFIALIIGLIMLTFKRLSQKNTVTNGESFEFQPGKIYEIQSENIKYMYKYVEIRRRKGGTIRYLNIWLACESLGEFSIGKENFIDRFFRKIGICCEIQTGDPEFDSKFYVQTNTVDFTQQYFSSPEKREIIRNIFTHHSINVLWHNGKIMQVEISPFSPSPQYGKEFFAEIVEKLKQLSQGLPDFFPERHKTLSMSWKVKRDLVMGLATFLFFGGLVGFFVVRPSALNNLDVLMFSLKFSIPLFFIFIVISTLLIKGRSSSHTELITVLFLSIFGFFLTGYQTVNFINQHFDPMQVTSHICPVVDKQIVRGRKSRKNYYIFYPSWVDHRVKRLSIPSSQYPIVAPGKAQLDIRTKPGRLGFEWITSYGLKM